MVMGEAGEPVDFLVIGGGPGGTAAAARAAELGRSVTLIEDSALGGVCLNIGCIPSKALIDFAHIRESAGQLFGADILSPPDLSAWQDRRTKLVGDLAAGLSHQLKGARVNVISGRARLTSRGRVAVQTTAGESKFLEFRDAVLASGSRPAALACAPFDSDRVIDSTGALSLRSVPDRVLVIGAGYIGIELATALAKLGVQVTVAEAQKRILPELPPGLARPVMRRLRELGVEVLTGAVLVEVTSDGGRLQIGERPVDVTADKVLIAVGRLPNTDDIGLEAARLKTTAKGRISVGDDRIVDGTSIAAIGDITDGPMLAHKASAEGVVAAEALCGLKTSFDPAAIPLVVFSDPEIASAGLTEDAAREAGIEARSASIPLTALGRAATMGAGSGLVQMVVDARRDVVIGVHLACPHASELIAEAVLAIEMAASPGDLAASVHAHPTLAEGLQVVAAQLASAKVDSRESR